MEATTFASAKAEDIRSADKAGVRPTFTMIRREVQRITDRIIREGMF